MAVATREHGPAATRQALSGWGRTAASVAELAAPTSDEQVAQAVLARPARGVVARGLGRSYGDAAQNAGGAVLDLRSIAPRARRRRPRRAGDRRGRRRRSTRSCTCCCRSGWFVPVTPGTRSVTVGGAIAADVHGKDHHVSGSFCDAVERLDLLARPTGPSAPSGPTAIPTCSGRPPGAWA